MIGDLVRLLEHRARHACAVGIVGLVVGFVGLESTGWADPNELCAKIAWTTGAQSVNGLSTLERVRR
jgi:hypothetical protein